jgi:hypothetical protein
MSVGNMGPFGYLVNAPRVLKGNGIAFKLPSRQAREQEERSLTDISELPVFCRTAIAGRSSCNAEIAIKALFAHTLALFVHSYIFSNSDRSKLRYSYSSTAEISLRVTTPKKGLHYSSTTIIVVSIFSLPFFVPALRRIRVESMIPIGTVRSGMRGPPTHDPRAT